MTYGEVRAKNSYKTAASFQTDRSEGALRAKDTMWAFLMMGGQKANISRLKELVNDLITATTQKTAGQEKRKAKGNIDWNELDMILWGIVIEATALVLSGEI